MPANNPFTPKSTGTTSITSAVTSARVALVPSNSRQMVVTNSDGTNAAFVELGGSAVAAVVPNGATPGSMPILPGTSRSITIGDGVTHAAAICSSGTATVFFTPGNGI